MALLMVRTAAARDEAPAVVMLQGHQQSPAASLDYALGCTPNWLLDLFGVDRNGVAIAARIFRRSNPEMKRPGPVSVTVNEHFLPRSAIHILIDDEPAANPVIITALADELEAVFYADRRDARREIPLDPEESKAVPLLEQVCASLNPEIPIRFCPCCGQKLPTEDADWAFGRRKFRSNAFMS